MSLGSPKLDALLAQANAAFDALSPEEQQAHRRAQRISWVWGELRLSGYDVTEEEVARSVDEYDAKLQADKLEQRVMQIYADATNNDPELNRRGCVALYEAGREQGSSRLPEVALLTAKLDHANKVCATYFEALMLSGEQVFELRVKLTALTAEIKSVKQELLAALLDKFYTVPDEFLESPQRLLAGDTPNARIAAGQIDDVLALVRQLQDGAFV